MPSLPLFYIWSISETFAFAPQQQQVWIEVGEKLLFLEPNHAVIGKVSSAYVLKAHQYIRLQAIIRHALTPCLSP